MRWQTIQILLDPDEHVSYLQNAVERWDIFSPNGTVFPKSIPREAFPAEPDPEMIQWHETVSQKFEFDYWKKKRIYSPPSTFGAYQNQFSSPKESPTSSKEEEFVQSHHPRSSSSSYRYSVPADPQTSRRHQRRQSAEVPPSNLHKPQASQPRRSAEFAPNGYGSPRAPSPPAWPKHASSKSRGRERKTYSRPVSPDQIHGHSSSDASSEDSGTATGEPASPSPRDDYHRNLSPPYAPNTRRHSHEAYSRRPREASPEPQRRYAYRDAYNSGSNRMYDSDSGRGPRQPRGYIDEVRQSRTPVPDPGPGHSGYRDPVYGGSSTVPTSPVYGHAHPVHPGHPRFVNVGSPGYMVHPQSELDANVMDDPRRSNYRGGSLTPNPSGSTTYGRPRFASVGDFQPPRWASMHAPGPGPPPGLGSGPVNGGRGVPPGMIEADYGRRSTIYDR